MRDKIMSLEGRELDCKIAEFMGWTGINKSNEYGFLTADGLTPGTNQRDHIPNYSTDHNAAYEAEERIKETRLQERYIDALCDVAAKKTDYAVDGMWQMIHATPEQRCRAALLAIEGGGE